MFEVPLVLNSSSGPSIGIVLPHGGERNSCDLLERPSCVYVLPVHTRI